MNALYLQPGPPLSQIVISSLASGLDDGKNQKYNSRVSFEAEEMGRRPAYDSPMSKLTSGIAVPLTANSFGKIQFSLFTRQGFRLLYFAIEGSDTMIDVFVSDVRKTVESPAAMAASTPAWPRASQSPSSLHGACSELQ